MLPFCVIHRHLTVIWPYATYIYTESTWHWKSLRPRIYARICAQIRTIGWPLALGIKRSVRTLHCHCNVATASWTKGKRQGHRIYLGKREGCIPREDRTCKYFLCLPKAVLTYPYTSPQPVSPPHTLTISSWPRKANPLQLCWTTLYIHLYATTTRGFWRWQRYKSSTKPRYKASFKRGTTRLHISSMSATSSSGRGESSHSLLVLH